MSTGLTLIFKGPPPSRNFFPNGNLDLLFDAINENHLFSLEMTLSLQGSGVYRLLEGKMSSLKIKLEPSERKSVSVTLEWKQHLSIKDAIEQLPISLCFVATVGNSSSQLRELQHEVKLDFAWFLGGLRDPKAFGHPPSLFPSYVDPLPVLLFGMAGAGKSSFINSCHMMLHPSTSDKAPPAREIAGGMGDHTTKTLRKIELQDTVGLPLTLIDTWGLTQHTYKAEELKLILQGRVPIDWKMNEDIFSFMSNTPDKKMAPLAVLFFVPHESMQLESEDEMALIRNAYGKMEDQGFKPLLVITKMDGDDDFGRAMAGNPMFPCNQASERANVLKDISKKFGCTQAQVLLTVNYQDDKKNFELDRSFYKTLHSVMQEAMSNKKSMAIKDTKEAVKESKAKNAKARAEVKDTFRSASDGIKQFLSEMLEKLVSNKIVSALLLVALYMVFCVVHMILAYFSFFVFLIIIGSIYYVNKPVGSDRGNIELSRQPSQLSRQPNTLREVADGVENLYNAVGNLQMEQLTKIKESFNQRNLPPPRLERTKSA